MSRPNIIYTALKMAKILSQDQSEDPYTKVGACGIRPDKTLIFGYNGAPPKINIDWSDREQKNLRVVHAEANLLKYCKPGEIDTIVVTHSPCIYCLPMIASYGVKEIYFEQYYHKSEDVDIIAYEFNIKLQQISLD